MSLEIFSKPQEFCCQGCRAVCVAILDSGLDDYYKYRSAKADKADELFVPEALLKYEIYDNADIQKDFAIKYPEYVEANLILENIRCPACLWLIEKHIRELTGVIAAKIDVASDRMLIRWQNDKIKLSYILQAIQTIGYKAQPYNNEHKSTINKLSKRRSIEKIIFAGIIGMMVMNFSIATYLVEEPDGILPLWMQIGRLGSLLSTFAILIYSGQDFFIGAYYDIKSKRLGMDVPIVLGLSIAFIGSINSMIHNNGEVYFDSITMFVFLVLLARHWEIKGRIRSSAYIDQLAVANPSSANVWQEHSQSFVKKNLIDLKDQDIVRVLAGETVPVDGIVKEGLSSFDESLITGESTPVQHMISDKIFAGSVNIDQAVNVIVNNVKTGNTIQKISDLVDEALINKPEIALLADKASKWFVLGVLLIAVFTAVFWFFVDSASWLANTVSVLIVTCPCALALATPVALSVSAGRLIQSGILPIKMRAIDLLASVKSVVFDKTGTLTTGKLRLLSFYALDGFKKEACLLIVRSLVERSEHPVAVAIKREVGEVSYDIERFKNIPGEGISACLKGKNYKFGNLNFALSGQIPSTELADIMKQYPHSTISILSCEEQILAIFVFSDKLRHHTKELLLELKKLGFQKSAILSGDRQEAVEQIASVLHIKNYQGLMSPEDKLNWIKQAQKIEPCLMLGDGINDAPVLAESAVSISHSDATDLANFSSDFILLGGNLIDVISAIKIARKTKSIIRQNTVWAILYNSLTVPFAAAGMIPPWAAALGMSASSLVVVYNALRLRRP